MAGKAGKVWSLPRFWVSIHSYKKQTVKKFLVTILDLAWLKFAVAALHITSVARVAGFVGISKNKWTQLYDTCVVHQQKQANKKGPLTLQKQLNILDHVVQWNYNI